MNAKFEEISGFQAEDMFGEQWVNSLHPEDRTRVIAEWYNAIGWNQPFESEHRLLRADGRIVWTNVKVATIRSGETTIGFVGTMEDVTDRREAELKLQKNNLELQAAHSRLEEQTAQLGQQAQKLLEAHERAEQASRSKSEFLANMSHEIRTPMTAILGYADMLYEDGNINHAPEGRLNAIRTIQRNGLHLLGIINDILDLSKIEAGKLAVEFIECSPKHIVDDVLSLMKIRSQAKGIELVAEYETAVPETILSDPTRIRQILMNLVGNAIKFTEVGAVRLQVRFVNDDPARMEFDVVDTGIGLTEEQRERLFRPFSQADNSMSRQFGGTGLGLTISKRLATMLGGDTFIVQSQLGAGTRFRFSVAAESPAGARLLSFNNDRTDDSRLEPSTTVVRRNSQRISGCRVLLAEDSPDNQRLITYILKKEGADMTVVENGESAVKQAIEAWNSNQPFDVILMDMQMPVLDGYTATSRLRAAGYTLPIIALTAHTMASDRQKCIDAGCDDHAPKPINRDKLVELIATYCTAQPQRVEEAAVPASSSTLG